MHSGSTHQFGQRCNPGHLLWHISVLSPGNAGAGIRISDDGELLAPGSPGQKISWRELGGIASPRSVVIGAVFRAREDERPPGPRAVPPLDINGGSGSLQGSPRSSASTWGSVNGIDFPANTPTALPPRRFQWNWVVDLPRFGPPLVFSGRTPLSRLHSRSAGERAGQYASQPAMAGGRGSLNVRQFLVGTISRVIPVDLVNSCRFRCFSSSSLSESPVIIRRASASAFVFHLYGRNFLRESPGLLSPDLLPGNRHLARLVSQAEGSRGVLRLVPRDFSDSVRDRRPGREQPAVSPDVFSR